MSESSPQPQLQTPTTGEPPRTGNPLVDRALADVADLDPRDPAAHHDRLAAAHERLHLALDPDAPAPEEPTREQGGPDASGHAAATDRSGPSAG